jgi:hypothetical protein
MSTVRSVCGNTQPIETGNSSKKRKGSSSSELCRTTEKILLFLKGVLIILRSFIVPVSTQNEVHTTTTMPFFDISKDFTLGALTVVGVAGAYKIWQLFQYPSLVANEKTWSQQIQNMGDNSKVVSRCLFVSFFLCQDMGCLLEISYIVPSSFEMI